MDFYGRCRDVNNFKILRGERCLIEELKLYVEDVINSGNIKYFALEPTSSNIDLNGIFELANVGKFFTRMKLPRCNTTDGQKQAIQTNLHNKVRNILISNNVDAASVNQFKIDDILIDIDDQESIQCKLICVLCSAKIKISSIGKKKQNSWSFSNFQRHLVKLHKLKPSFSQRVGISSVITNDNVGALVRTESALTKDNVITKDTDEKETVETDNPMDNNDTIYKSIRKKKKISSIKLEELQSSYSQELGKSLETPEAIDDTNSSESTAQSITKDVAHEKAIVGTNNLMDIHSSHEESFENIENLFDIHDANRSLTLAIETIDPLDAEVYRQISHQLLKMTEACLVNDETMSQMVFEISGEMRSLDVVKIAADGNCLFRAIVHQLYGFALDSEASEKGANEIRAEVVQFIQNDLDSFKHEIKGCIYDQRAKKNNTKYSKIDDFEKEAINFLQNHLSKTTCWGGFESLKAVSMKYAANIMIINEESSMYYVTQFNPQCKITLLLAYRLNQFYGVDGSGGPRNHYDSIVNIDAENMTQIAETMASKDLNIINENTILIS